MNPPAPVTRLASLRHRVHCLPISLVSVRSIRVLRCRGVVRQELCGEESDEAGVAVQVPPPQPPGLVHEAEQPFEAEPLHKPGRLPLLPARKSNAAPTPSMTASTACLLAAIQRSCLGVPNPTNRMRAPEPVMLLERASSSSAVGSPNGGLTR